MTLVGSVAANFTRDLDQNYALIAQLAEEARERGVEFLALPEAAIGGYLSSLGNHGDTVKTTSRSLPPAIRVDGPELARVQEIVGDLMVAIGFCELDDDGETRYNAAALLDGGQVYGSYRKVHQPLGEHMSYSPGPGYSTFDTPVGRVGLQICYDKAFPEAARSMALDGAEIIASSRPGPRRGRRPPRTCRTTAGPTASTSSTSLGPSTTRCSGSRRTSRAPSARCATWATRRSSIPAATSSPRPCSARGWRSPTSMCAARSRPCGAGCSTSATAGPTRTAHSIASGAEG
ncbi:carbon-nitrogen hydrolase family protein [Rathayibacter oskolensis]|nr:carbon-nitrogen hydrolase family protein [Rathayibacter oskolensis]WKK72847.1 carbon-nitrogen hydrolase family protein [Rathayibacter oskolensis]